MIRYQIHTESISADMLRGFFVGWPNHPTNKSLLEILQNSSHIVIAVDDDKKKVIGFIQAVSDNILSAYIPLLEVLPEYQKQGIGTELVKRLLEQLQDFYMIDLCCDIELNNFYEKLGFQKANSQIIRNYKNQKK